MERKTNPNGSTPRPVKRIFQMTNAEDKRLSSKMNAHGVSRSELIRRAIEAYPVRPSVES